MERNKETGSKTMSRIYNTSDHHYSKKTIFRNVCSGCGKPLRRNAKNKIGYLCRKCGPSYSMAYDSEKHACYNCQFEFDCTARVQLGLWVRCETPDIGDLERLKFSGGLDDEDIRRELEASLEFRGDRKVLEETVSKGASKVYQMYLTRSKGEMPIGIRE